MLQQLLCDRSGYAALSKDGAERFAQIMKVQVRFANDLSQCVPTTLTEVVVEYLLLRWVQARYVVLELFHYRNSNRP